MSEKQIRRDQNRYRVNDLTNCSVVNDCILWLTEKGSMHYHTNNQCISVASTGLCFTSNQTVALLGLGNIVQKIFL